MSAPSSTSEKRSSSPFFPDYYCNDRTLIPSTFQSIETNEVPIAASQGIDPSLQQMDNLRRATLDFPLLDSKNRPTFTSMLAEAGKDPGHDAFKNKLRDMIQNKEEKYYGRYLANLHLDLYCLELFLKRTFPSLPKLLRSEALGKDIFNFNPIPRSNLQKHLAYFTSRIDSPHMLLPHYAVNLLGLLAEGKHIAKRVTEKWGEKVTTNVYQFTDDPEQLRLTFKKELNDYAETLSDQQLEELHTELKQIWPMVNELIG